MRINDFVFFPAAFLAASGMIGLALIASTGRPLERSIGGARLGYEQLTLQGEDLQWIFLPDGASGQLRSGQDGAFLVLTSDPANASAVARQNPHYRIGPDVESAFAGRAITIMVRARRSRPGSGDYFALNYTATANEDSGWQSYMLSDDFQDYVFTYSPPPRSGDAAVDYLGIRSEDVDDKASIDIAMVQFRLGRKTR